MSELTRAQWEILGPLLPVCEHEPGKAGRPRIDNKTIITSIFWILCTSAPWKGLSIQYGGYQTCHRRYQQRLKEWVLDKIQQTLVADLERYGKFDLIESFIDGTFSSEKKCSWNWQDNARKRAQDHGNHGQT